MNAPFPMVALVPMRHHSERVPEKNFRPFAGKPLYSQILETLLACPGIDEIVVDTDSDTIMEGVARRFPSARLIERPASLWGDDVSMNAVLTHDVNLVPAPFYLQTHSTNPLLLPETISRAIATFSSAYPDRDSLFSVTRRQVRYWDAQGRAVNHDPNVLLRTQDLPPFFEENSCLYIFERETFLRLGNRIGERPLLFEIDRIEAWDIDEMLDFHVAEFLFLKRGRHDPGERRS